MTTTGVGRSPLTRSLRLGLLFLGAVLIGVTAAVLAVLLEDPAVAHEEAWGYAVVTWLYVLAGTLAWWRRPSNGMGPLIVWGGVTLLLLSLGTLPGLATLGAVTATFILAVMVHLLHAFPSGRLRSTASRITVVGGYLVCSVLQIPLYAFNPAAEGLPVFIAARPDLVVLGETIQAISGAAVMVATVVILAIRLRRSNAWQRRILVPLFGYGMIAVLFIPFSSSLLEGWFGWTTSQVGFAQLVDIAGVPIAFSLAVLRGGFARTGEVQELATWLSAPSESRPDVSAALASVLGDPSLRVVFHVPERSGFVDADGLTVELPGSGDTLASVPIELSGSVVGAVVYDSDLIADPELVRAAGRLVALAVDRERLTAALLATEQSLRRSRERLVETADRERRRIAQDLHDGLQVKLVLLAIDAQRLANQAGNAAADRERAVELRHGIDVAAAELRSLVHAVMPSSLLERGLGLAAEDLVDRLPVPTDLHLGNVAGLPTPLASTAYFVVAEALTNVVKHAGASRASVRLDCADGTLSIDISDDGCGGASREGGSGIRGLADRVDVLGGTFRLDSPVGSGTRLSIRLPVSLDAPLPGRPETPAAQVRPDAAVGATSGVPEWTDTVPTSVVPGTAGGTGTPAPQRPRPARATGAPSTERLDPLPTLPPSMNGTTQ
ncbi:sensor histidine kinase [Nakamurella sp. YIM 132087]|uniref:histidine kinase n=1 Tax=Nakamurella alba TaxID=2665158 RepID=A0A7K1FSY7_9ACTN|nr:ATP-binding protein [Nakamurella alba]MTD17200.1 sensor histidine kinase [Nakamurella alba]